MLTTGVIRSTGATDRKWLQIVQKKMKGGLRRSANSDMPHGGPRWESEDGTRGYRIEPPHPTGQHKSSGWHIDWYDWSRGKKGKGGMSGTIELGEL